jgi:DNA polymerase-1
LERQGNPYPSLEETSERYGIGAKLKEVEEYWERGVQTSEIPRDVLDKYVRQDVDITYQVYLAQQKLIKPSQRTLFRLAMLDLLCLEELEWNGMRYDKIGIEKKSKEIESEIAKLQSELNLYHSIPNFNWASSDHLSALLFGGTITEKVKVPCGHYKSGAKSGEVKYKTEVVEHHLPRRYTPKRTTPGGKYSTDESSLVELDGSDLVKGILRIKELEKLNTTYFRGLLEKTEKFNFEPEYLHSSFNQSVTKTGRLSSTKPNLQNKPEALDEFIITRFS